MLNVLSQKKRRLEIENIEVIEAAWEHALVEPADVVLAAWSLYRQIELLPPLQKLIDATRRTLIIIESDDDAVLAPSSCQRNLGHTTQTKLIQIPYFSGCIVATWLSSRRANHLRNKSPL